MIDYITLPDGTCTSDNLKKAEALNQYFASIFTNKDTSSIPPFYIDASVDSSDLPYISFDTVYSKLLILET